MASKFLSIIQTKKKKEHGCFLSSIDINHIWPSFLCAGNCQQDRFVLTFFPLDKPITIQKLIKSTSLIYFNLDEVFDKIREKQTQQQAAKYRTWSPPLLFLHLCTSKRPISVVKYGKKLQKTYAKLKPGEKIDP